MLCVLERERPNTTGHPREVANHKAIFGICVDPLSPHTLATHAEVSSICFGGVHQGDVFPYMVVQCYFVYVCTGWECLYMGHPLLRKTCEFS